MPLQIPSICLLSEYYGRKGVKHNNTNHCFSGFVLALMDSDVPYDFALMKRNVSPHDKIYRVGGVAEFIKAKCNQQKNCKSYWL